MFGHAQRMGLPSLCILAGIASFLFSQSQTQIGYTILTADPGSSVPVGSALFTVTNSQGVLVSQAGVAAAEPILSGRIFVDESGPQTGIALVNTSLQDASVTFILRDSGGGETGRKTQTLETKKHLATFVFQLFSSLSPSFSGSLTFESSQALAAIALRQNLNALREPLYTTLPVVDLSASPSSQSLVFPHVAAGDGYSTQILLINTTAQTLKGSISLTDSKGDPLVLLSNGNTDSRFSYSIDPHGTFSADFGRSTDLKTGYALLSPEPGTPAPVGSAVFQFRKNQSIVTEAAVAATSLTSSARIFVDNVASYTGVALANPAAQPADVTFSLLDRFGSSLDSTTRTLAAKGHIAIFAHELFPGLPGTFTGLIEISSSVPVAPITLKLVINQRSDLVLTTLPVADLTRLPSASSVVFPHIAIGGEFSTRLILINSDKSKTSSGKLAFFKSDSSAMSIPLGGKTDTQFSYLLAPGSGRQLLPGNTAPVASISLIDLSTNQITRETVVNEGQFFRPGCLVLDGTGLARDDFDLSFASLSTDVATIDATGNIQGRKAGFSTLTVSSGSTIATATITVVNVSSGVTGFEITGVTQDLARRLYLANSGEHSILLAQDLKQTPVTYAGVPKSAGLKDDARLRSLFRNPSFLALDQAQASLFVSDSENHVIRRVHPGGADKVETLAGTGVAGGSDGPAKEAAFNRPQGVALDGRGYLWVADSGNHTIRRVNLTTGNVNTVAGKAGAAGWQDGNGDKARFSSPAGIALETESLARQLEREGKGEPPPPVSILVADTENGVVRRVKGNGEVETIRSGGPGSPAGKRNGAPALAASTGTPIGFNAPTGIAVDSLGSVYVSEPGSGRIRVILSNGDVLPATQPKTLLTPWGIVIMQNGKAVVADRNRAASEISYGEPQITSIAPAVISNKGGDNVTVKGNNFAPESLIVVAGVLVPKVEYQDSQTLRFVAPPMPSGRGTLTVQHRGGLAQKAIAVDAVPLISLTAGQITTVAGGATFAGDGSAASTARLALPVGTAIDKSGNIFVADRDNNRIRKISAATGIITSVAGSGLAGFSGENGPATAAALDGPEGVAVDSSGNLLVADSHNYRIRRVSADTGIITTIAGGGEPADGLGDDGLATAAIVSGVSGIALDQADNIYIADAGNNRIRKIDAKTKIIATVAGNGTRGFSGDNGPASQACLNAPERIALDAAGNLFIADTANYRVRKVDASSGVISTVAGNGRPEFSGDQGPAAAAQMEPSGVAVDVNGNIFIADRWNVRVRKVDAATKIVSTVAGGGSSLGDDGPATAAELRFVHGIALDGVGNLVIADSGNHRVRKVAALTQVITTLAGGIQSGFLGDDGPATAASLGAPLAAVPDASGNIYIADTDNNRVRKVDARTGTISTFAGTGEETFSGNGGPATAAAFVGPSGIALDAAGNVFFAAAGNSMVLKVDITTGILSAVAGDRDKEGYSGDNGLATLAGMNFPHGIAIDSNNNLFIADTGNNRIRKVDLASKFISTVAGGGSSLGDNGLATAAALDQPHAVAADKQGNLYIADTSNNRIRKVGTNGIITTIAGTGGDGFSGDGGPAASAEISAPRCVALDDAGNLYIADSNNLIRRVDARTLIITTVAGVEDLVGSSGDNGPATAAALAFPYGVSLDASGNLYITDTYNHRIRAVKGPLK